MPWYRRAAERFRQAITRAIAAQARTLCPVELLGEGLPGSLLVVDADRHG